MVMEVPGGAFRWRLGVGIVLLTAEAGQKAPSQGLGIFCVIMSADLWRYQRLNF